MIEPYKGQGEDERVLTQIGLTLDEIECDAKRVEDESQDDNLADYYYPKFHLSKS